MLADMRLQIEVRPEDQDPLRTLAWEHHRTVREHAGFLLHQAIQTAIQPDEPEHDAAAEVSEVA